MNAQVGPELSTLSSSSWAHDANLDTIVQSITLIRAISQRLEKKNAALRKLTLEVTERAFALNESIQGNWNVNEWKIYPLNRTMDWINSLCRRTNHFHNQTSNRLSSNSPRASLSVLSLPELTKADRSTLYSLCQDFMAVISVIENHYGHFSSKHGSKILSTPENPQRDEEIMHQHHELLREIGVLSVSKSKLDVYPRKLMDNSRPIFEVRQQISQDGIVTSTWKVKRSRGSTQYLIKKWSGTDDKRVRQAFEDDLKFRLNLSSSSLGVFPVVGTIGRKGFVPCQVYEIPISQPLIPFMDLVRDGLNHDNVEAILSVLLLSSTLEEWDRLCRRYGFRHGSKSLIVGDGHSGARVSTLDWLNELVVHETRGESGSQYNLIYNGELVSADEEAQPVHLYHMADAILTDARHNGLLNALGPDVIMFEKPSKGILLREHASKLTVPELALKLIHLELLGPEQVETSPLPGFQLARGDIGYFENQNSFIALGHASPCLRQPLTTIYVQGPRGSSARKWLEEFNPVLAAPDGEFLVQEIMHDFENHTWTFTLDPSSTVVNLSAHVDSNKHDSLDVLYHWVLDARRLRKPLCKLRDLKIVTSLIQSYHGHLDYEISQAGEHGESGDVPPLYLHVMFEWHFDQNEMLAYASFDPCPNKEIFQDRLNSGYEVKDDYRLTWLNRGLYLNEMAPAAYDMQGLPDFLLSIADLHSSQDELPSFALGVYPFDEDSPHFWLRTLNMVNPELITRSDAAVLSCLVDMDVEISTGGNFNIIFTFTSNPWFENSAIRLQCQTCELDQKKTYHTSADEILWKTTDNPTVGKVKRVYESAGCLGAINTTSFPIETFFGFLSFRDRCSHSTCLPPRRSGVGKDFRDKRSRLVLELKSAITKIKRALSNGLEEDDFDFDRRWEWVHYQTALTGEEDREVTQAEDNRLITARTPSSLDALDAVADDCQKEFDFETFRTQLPGYTTPHTALDWTGFLETDSIVGVGTFGDVYKGRWINLPEGLSEMPPPVVIKVFRGQSLWTGAERERRVKGLTRELKVWSHLKHPNIVPLVGTATFLDHESSPVSLWMEHGRILNYLTKNPEADRLKLSLGVARGIQYLHDFDPEITHGDLKADNILVDGKGIPRIADFGLSKMLEEDELWKTSKTSAGGTTRWQAPELMSGEEASVTTNADVYAYAMTALEIMTDRPPFSNLRTDVAVIKAITVDDRRPDRPRDDRVSDFLWEIWEACWIKEPGGRPSMSEVVERLQVIV